MSRKKYIKAFVLLIFIMTFKILSLLISNFYYENKIKNIILDAENKIIISLKNSNLSYCSLGTSMNNIEWTKSKDNKCIIDFKDENSTIYI